MNAPDKKISRLMAAMNIAGDSQAAALLGLLVANGTVDLDLRFKLKGRKTGDEMEITVAQAIGWEVVTRGDASNIMRLSDELGEEVICRFFDWRVDGEHIATSKLKEIAKGDGHNNKSAQAISKSKLAPSGGLDTWISLLCRNRNPEDILDDEALVICMGSRMPQTHGAIAQKTPAGYTLSNGSRLWSHARSEYQFTLMAGDAVAMQNEAMLLDLSNDCEARRERGKPTAFANALDKNILQRLMSKGDMTRGSRAWINQRVGELTRGKNGKWLENDSVRAWTKAWIQANPGQDLSEQMRQMLLNRRSADSNSLLEHYIAILEDKPLFQMVGQEAMVQKFLQISHERFRGRGETNTLDKLVKHIGWPQLGRPHIVQLGLAPCGAEKGDKKDSLNKMAEILNHGGEAVWGDDTSHTAGLLLGKIHSITVNGGDGSVAGSMIGCLSTLNRVLENGEGKHPSALRFCGALSTYMVVQQSALADRCLQIMIETSGEAEQAIALSGGKPLHEVLDDIMVTLKNSKKREPFQAFKSMTSMRANTAAPQSSASRPRF